MLTINLINVLHLNAVLVCRQAYNLQFYLNTQSFYSYDENEVFLPVVPKTNPLPWASTTAIF